MSRSSKKRNTYYRGYELPTATKTPPMIAPGILCPKCKGPMLDERTTKRTDKSPDYTCANLTCVQTGTNGKSYRTAVWEKDLQKNGSTPAAPAPAGGSSSSVGGSAGAESDKPKLTKLYLDATEFVIDKVLPKYVEAGIGVSDTAIIAAVATLFIAASKER